MNNLIEIKNYFVGQTSQGCFRLDFLNCVALHCSDIKITISILYLKPFFVVRVD